jgi:cytochrome c peroxidase
MHNGVMPTLESVVKFYDIGGGAGMGIPSRQTLPPDSLRLTTRERDALVAFLQSLDARGR